MLFRLFLTKHTFQYCTANLALQALLGGGNANLASHFGFKTTDAHCSFERKMTIREFS